MYESECLALNKNKNVKVESSKLKLEEFKTEINIICLTERLL